MWWAYCGRRVGRIEADARRELSTYRSGGVRIAANARCEV